MPKPKGKSPCYFLFARGPTEIVAITTVGVQAEALIKSLEAVARRDSMQRPGDALSEVDG